MLKIIHRSHGDPARVLELADESDPGVPGLGQVLIRVALVAIHPGDLQSVAALPNFGSPTFIGYQGRTPGFEGTGVIEAIGDGIDPALGLRIGQRVVYFPVEGGWAEKVLAPASAVTLLPDDVSFEVAAQVLINTASAEIIIRAGHAAWPDDERDDVTVLQSGAASAVGRIVTALLAERGVRTIRLVRSLASADRLEAGIAGSMVIATEDADWVSQLRAAVGEKRIHVALDGVGGPLLPLLAELVYPGGTIISYGALGGALTDIRLVVPRGLKIQGVSMAQWGALPADMREADVHTALRLASDRPDLFAVEAIYPPAEIAQAVEHMERTLRSGAILVDFRGARS
jgi:NADPH:quinone reductase-like Zn-dependent oxidoreductase